MKTVDEIVNAWGTPLYRTGLHTLHSVKNVSTPTLRGKAQSIIRYEIDMSKPAPIEIPAHLAELLPSEESLQEMDNFFPGSSDFLLELAQQASGPVEASIAQAASVVVTPDPKNYRRTSMLLHLHEQRLLQEGLQDADTPEKSS